MFVSVTTITCVNGDWPCQLEIAIFDPLPHITFNRSPKYLLDVITSSALTGPNLVQHLVQIHPLGLLSKWVK